MKIYTYCSALTLTLALTTSALTTPALANTPLEEMTIVSSRIAMPVREVATSVSIITAEDLDIRGFNNLANALRYDPGITVTNSGGAGKTTSLRIRGESGARTKVFLDGIELTDTSSPQAAPHFEHLTTSGIGRVEILRGPQGMMYGADAGGVVYIDTQQTSEGLRGAMAAQYGKYDTTELNGHFGGRDDRVDFLIAASTFDTDGFNSRDTDTVLRDDDGYQNDTLHARGGWNIIEGLRLEAVGHTIDADNEFDNCSIPITFDSTDRCTGDFAQDSWRIALEHNNEVMTHSVAYSENSTDREFFSAGQSVFATTGELSEIRYLGSYRDSSAASFVYGIESREEELDDGIADDKRDQLGYFLEYQGAFNNNVFLTAGARYDDNDDFGSETTYRISAAYLMPAASGEWKYKATYGTGFRAPSLSELAYNRSLAAAPPASDTTLGAETSEGFDIGFGFYSNTHWFAELVYFDQRIEDEIFFDLEDFSGYLQGNGKSSSNGVELISEISINDWLIFSGNHTYTNAEDADGERRIRVPKHATNLALIATTLEERLTLGLSLRSNRDYDDARGEIKDYEVLNLNANYRVSDNLELFARAENVLDEDYQELPTYRASERAAYIGIRYLFKL